MKSRTQLVIVIGLLILGGIMFTVARQSRLPVQVFPATINRDCAPWDGSAFIVSIPMSDGALLNISIWQAPDIHRPVTFSFPDDSSQVGNAGYQAASGEYEQLSGTVFFRSVEEGSQVEGRFELVTEAGRRFEGQFKADWENQFILCG